MPIRDTFWNVPYWAEIGQYVLGLGAILIFLVGFFLRVRRWRQGQPDKRTDQLLKRTKSLVVQSLGQVKTAEDRFAGVMHLTIFWGLIVLVLGTALATIDWDVTHLFFDFQFLTGNVYLIYELCLDLFGLLMVVGIGMAAYRRYVLRPTRLTDRQGPSSALDNAFAIVILALIAVSGYLVEGLRIAVLQPDWAVWSPLGNAIAAFFIANGDPMNQVLHISIWVFHGLVSFAAIASIPFTKFFHAAAAPLNIFFQSLQPAGELAPARTGGSVGVSKWQDFTWKQLLDFDSCIKCGRCQDQCPASQNGMVLSPKEIMLNLRKATRAGMEGRGLHGEVIGADELWACTSCKACVEVCPIFCDPFSAIVDMRRHLAYEGQVDLQLQEALANLGRYGNSFGQSPRARAQWTRLMEPKIKDARREAVEYLWFVGDYASYSPTVTGITQKTAAVFYQAGLDFGILYEAEQNAGNDVRRVGEEGLFEMLMEKNLKAFEKARFSTLVTTDPHSYNTLKNEYAAYNGGHAVLHYTELLDQLIGAGRLRFEKKLNIRAAYQDPCYLGRYNGIYEAPRRVIEATGATLVELPRSKDEALCCGAGGGRIWMEEGEVKERPSEKCVREAVEQGGISTLVVACPKDVTMFQDAIKTTGLEDRLEVKDLIELVVDAM